MYKYIIFDDKSIIQTVHKSLEYRKIAHTLSYAHGYIMFESLPEIQFKRLKNIQLYEITPVAVLGKDNR